MMRWAMMMKQATLMSWARGGNLRRLRYVATSGGRCLCRAEVGAPPVSLCELDDEGLVDPPPFDDVYRLGRQEGCRMTEESRAAEEEK